MSSPVLQVIDSILLNYNIGDVLLLVAAVGALVSFLRRAETILGYQLLSFGLLLLILPQGMLGPEDSSLLPETLFYKLVGLALLVVAPVIIAVSDR